MPSNSCGWAGLGTVGGNPSKAWIFRCDLNDVFGHEFGHNLGMHHASMLTSEYGDRSDIMGVSGIGRRQVNGPHKEQMNWLLSEQILPVTTSDVYDIAPLETDAFDAAYPQVLKILKPDTNEYYYLSYRLPIGFDANLSSTYSDQLNIHTYPGSGAVQTQFLDALQDGESYMDDTNSITLTQVSHSPDAVTVQISLDTTCNLAAPDMNLTPTAQNGEAGDSLTYTLSLANGDSAGCPAATWSLSSVAPDGWTASLSPSTVTVAPGTTGTATLSVASAASAAENSYEIRVDALDGASANHAANINATYAVMVDSQPPTAPSNLSATVNPNQVQLAWDPSTDDVGVSYYTIWRDGTGLATTGDTTYNDPSDNSGATYSYSITAHDEAGNVSSASNTVSVTVSSGKKGNGKGGGNGKGKK